MAGLGVVVGVRDEEQADELGVVLGGGLGEVLQLGDGLGGGEVVR